MTACIILAAGSGTRLRPVTNSKPKCLVQFLGKPLLGHQIEILEDCGVEQIAIVTGYMSEKIEAMGFTTYHNSLYESSNMVESLFSAREFMKGLEEDLLVSYGDIVYEKKNLEAVLKMRGDLSVMVDKGWEKLWSLRNEHPLEDAETLKLDEGGFIRELGKKPRSYDDIEGQYTGLLKIAAHKIAEVIKFYDCLDRRARYDGASFEKMYLTSFLQLLIDAGWRVRSAPVEHGWLEVDTLEDLKLYERLDSEGRLGELWRQYE